MTQQSWQELEATAKALRQQAAGMSTSGPKFYRLLHRANELTDQAKVRRAEQSQEAVQRFTATGNW